MSRTNIFSFLIVTAIIISVVLLSGKVIMANSTAGAGHDRIKCYTTVEIEPGDTLSSIAKEYISSEYSGADEYIDEVISLNHLTSTRIIAGEYIAVPYYTDSFTE